jgi:hypothetical protein
MTLVRPTPLLVSSTVAMKDLISHYVSFDDSTYLQWFAYRCASLNSSEMYWQRITQF